MDLREQLVILLSLLWFGELDYVELAVLITSELVVFARNR